MSMRLQEEGITAPIAAAPTQCETVESPAVRNESPQVEMSEPIVAEPIAAVPIAAVPIVAEPIAAVPIAAVPIVAEPIAAVPIAAVPIAAGPTVPVTNDGFGHSSHGCLFWHKTIGKPLCTKIGLGPSVNLQDLFNSARKGAIRAARKAGRNETKLTCSKCALATLSDTLVMPNGSDGDEKKRKDALRNALAAFLVAREVQG
jgi:hypothetical protein